MRDFTPIPTRWGGFHFRSRTEARWAVFFDSCRINFEYEPEGVVLPDGPYLPDFWLAAQDIWLEVKGVLPSPKERRKAEQLAVVSGSSCLIAVGSPQPDSANIMVVDPDGSWDDGYIFMEDRRNPGDWWISSESACRALGKHRGDHDRWPIVSERLFDAYTAAKSERFERTSRPEDPRRNYADSIGKFKTRWY